MLKNVPPNFSNLTQSNAVKFIATVLPQIYRLRDALFCYLHTIIYQIFENTSMKCSLQDEVKANF